LIVTEAVTNGRCAGQAIAVQTPDNLREHDTRQQKRPALSRDVEGGQVSARC